MPARTVEQLRSDALAIWHCGVDAVRPQRLMRAALRVEDDTLRIGGEPLALAAIGRIVVVGGAKAGAAMAAAVEEALGESVCREKQLRGWVNVPADCLSTSAPRWIHLHAARAAGVNEPSEAGVRGTAEILRLVGSLEADDLCLCLIGGGGSALLPAPAEGVTLADKLALTRYLSAAGANIAQLNTVRKQLSRIKGGGLARACRAGRLVALIISDVAGDPLSIIASGPTVPDDSAAADALSVLAALGARRAGIAPAAIRYLEQKAAEPPAAKSMRFAAGQCRLTNLIIGNLATAVDAAALEAQRRGYVPESVVATQLEGPAEIVGRELAERAVRMRAQPGPDCLISGGEPTVVLVESSRRGLGGRNQQVALAAGIRLRELGEGELGAAGCLILSGGTDGEDGPTDAAGAWVDAELLADAAGQRLDPADHLARNDAWHFFAPLHGLIRTGPTQTNVGDLRVVLVDRK